MEPITIITTALNLATPFLNKAGEKLADGFSELIWTWIKKPFITEDEKEVISNFQLSKNSEELIEILLEKLNQDNEYKNGFEKIVYSAKEELRSNCIQNIHNNGNIEKQINIEVNNGNIQM